MSEINTGYVPRAQHMPDDEASRAVANYGRRLQSRRRDVERLLLTPVLLAAGVVMLASLSLRSALRRGRRLPPLHAAALDHVHRFSDQYPLHLYPLVAKAFEAAYLARFLPTLLANHPRVLELAIGEGSLSAQVFPVDADVVGIDISPYSLRHAAVMAHVRTAVVGDCLAPPVLPGTFDVLIANNFLHHVTQKEAVLARWAPLARLGLFNESTRYWASAWARPYLFGRLGLHRRSDEAVAQLELEHLQSLRPLADLDAAVARDWDVTEQATYMSERTFFRCAVFSALLRCTGPPTPPRSKRLLLGPLRSVVIPLTRALARRLIAQDAFEPRERDAYVSYLAKSKRWSGGARAGALACAECGGALGAGDSCPECGNAYQRVDGMLFLLPSRLHHIGAAYSPRLAESVPAEHL